MRGLHLLNMGLFLLAAVGFGAVCNFVLHFIPGASLLHSVPSFVPSKDLTMYSTNRFSKICKTFLLLTLDFHAQLHGK